MSWWREEKVAREIEPTSSTSASVAPSILSRADTRFSTSVGEERAKVREGPSPDPTVASPARPVDAGGGAGIVESSCESSPVEDFAFSARGPMSPSFGVSSPSASKTPSTCGPSPCKSPRRSCSCWRMTAGETSRLCFGLASLLITPVLVGPGADGSGFCGRSTSDRLTSSSSSVSSRRSRRSLSSGDSRSRSSGSSPAV